MSANLGVEEFRRAISLCEGHKFAVDVEVDAIIIGAGWCLNYVDGVIGPNCVGGFDGGCIAIVIASQGRDCFFCTDMKKRLAQAQPIIKRRIVPHSNG